MNEKFRLYFFFVFDSKRDIFLGKTDPKFEEQNSRTVVQVSNICHLGVSEKHFFRFLSVSPNPSESIAHAFASHESPEERKSSVSQSKVVNIAVEVAHGIEMDDKVTNGIVNLARFGDVLPEKSGVIQKHQSNEASQCSRPHSKVQLMGLLKEYVEDRYEVGN